MKKKVGIVTLFGCFNYGNRLQNYAVTRQFEKRGYSVDTIVYEKSNIRKAIGRVYRRIGRFIKPNSAENRRYKSLNSFNRDRLSVVYKTNKNGLIPSEIAKEYDFFAVGSDQVWNPLIRQEERDNFFLNFAKRNQRICVSPSIAVNEIPTEMQNVFYKGLMGFPYLSCRESDGVNVIETLTHRKCEWIIDPTLSLTAEEWRSIETPVKIDKQYVLLFFLSDIDNDLFLNIKRYAEINDYEIIDLNNKKSQYYGSRPEAFLSLIDNAKMVFTDSFHATVFSIIMNSSFYVYDRNSSNMNNIMMSTRIISILDLFCIENRYNVKNYVMFDELYDYSETNEIIDNERKKFEQYLDRCLSQKDIPFYGLPEEKCNGCMVCEKKCPSKCIRRSVDIEGFGYPQLIDSSACIGCSMCNNSCPIINSNPYISNDSISYAAWNKDRESVEDSSSGAIFPKIAKYVIEQGGLVYGVVFDKNFNAIHCRASSIEEIRAMFGAKYMQSEIGNTYADVLEDLKKEYLVLFTGTPCQIAGLLSYLGKKYENLVTVDFVCHGCPSPKVWTKYLSAIRRKYLYDEDVKEVSFRRKDIDWQHYSMRIESENNSFNEQRENNLFFKGFLRNLYLRPSCHECHFKGLERYSDFTLGDFWGIERVSPNFYNDRGTSLVILHSKQSKQIWEEINADIEFTVVENEKYVGKTNTALMVSVKQNENRKVFFDEFDGNINILEVIDKYAVEKKRTLVSRIKGRIDLLSIKKK